MLPDNTPDARQQTYHQTTIMLADDKQSAASLLSASMLVICSVLVVCLHICCQVARWLSASAYCLLACLMSAKVLVVCKCCCVACLGEACVLSASMFVVCKCACCLLAHASTTSVLADNKHASGQQAR